MNDSKMCQMQLALENKHLQQNTQNGIYMSPLYFQRTTIEKHTKKMQKIVKITFNAVVSLAVSNIVALVLKPIAYAERGYHAYGGETFLAVMLVVLLFWLLSSDPKKRRYRK
ncbi:hypothetical protein [Anaerovorax sp. IOR16]|uniref:hypothetical protein n=1 Tax=Anaerovorax sp. IOR16 TaxID=2773458 RepID=UPI0019D1CC1F|nr:hypothetical protein [Anaerovorax sp. IOR16]